MAFYHTLWLYPGTYEDGATRSGKYCQPPLKQLGTTIPAQRLPVEDASGAGVEKSKIAWSVRGCRGNGGCPGCGAGAEGCGVCGVRVGCEGCGGCGVGQIGRIAAERGGGELAASAVQPWSSTCLVSREQHRVVGSLRGRRGAGNAGASLRNSKRSQSGHGRVGRCSRHVSARSRRQGPGTRCPQRQRSRSSIDSSPSVQALHRKGILGRCVLLCPLSILPAHRDRVIIIRNFEL